MNLKPLYQIINRDLAGQIASGRLKPGDRLASEAELAEHYGVSRMTLRQALSRLESDKLVMRRHGVGTFVSEPRQVQRRGNRLGSFHEEMGLEDDALSTRVLVQEVLVPPDEVARRFEFKPNQTAVRLLRVRLLNGKPIALQDSWIPYLVAPSLEHDKLVNGSLYRTLFERAGIEIAWAEQEVSAVDAEAEQAKWLEVSVGSSVLKIARISYTAGNVPIEVAQSWTLPELPLVLRVER